jgi:hypothetical protein
MDMRETALVYIFTADERKAFVGCGALIEGDLIVTCAHVVDDARALAPNETSLCVEFPFLREADPRHAKLIHSMGGRGQTPDVAFLRPDVTPDEALRLPLALENYEAGRAELLAFLRTRNTDDLIAGEIEARTTSKNWRKFTAEQENPYFAEKGSSGSPLSTPNAPNLMGVLAQADFGGKGQGENPRVGYIVPASLIRANLPGAERASSRFAKMSPLQMTKTQEPPVPARPAIDKYAPASGYVALGQGRAAEGEGTKDTHTVVCRLTFRGEMRATSEKGQITFGYRSAELFVGCENGRMTQPAFATPAADPTPQLISAAGRAEGGESWLIAATDGGFLRGDIFALAYGGEVDGRVASVEVAKGERPRMRGRVDLGLQVSDMDFGACGLFAKSQEKQKQALLTALLTKYGDRLRRIDLDSE